MSKKLLLSIVLTLGLAIYVSPRLTNAQSLSQQSSSKLSLADQELLQFMLEEEKLAHDVYTSLYQEWNYPVFSRIAQSETHHIAAIQNLMSRYGVEDPTISLSDGEFKNSDLQELYNAFMEQGSQSLADALAVGASIEEIDIADLRSYSAETQNVTIQRVLNQLEAGSSNHLRAFSQNYFQETGISYQPQTLTQADYNAIVEAKAGNGRNGGRGHNR
ncbi:MAG TPA: DUF2202 domain-containing protein [Anaerolineales bacterium]|nr:DUF2202 domain-containing protein [Anaerolineales bacterium]